MEGVEGKDGVLRIDPILPSTVYFSDVKTILISLYLSIWIDSKPIVWDFSWYVYRDNS